MIKYLFTLITIFLFLTSCHKKKTYTYVEIQEEEEILGGTTTKEKDPKTIDAVSDSAAYLDAYTKFCISLKVSKDMKESIGKVYSSPKAFKLYNSEGSDITNSVVFMQRDERLKEIENNVFSLKNTMKESMEKSKAQEIEAFKQNNTIDSAKINALSKFFSIKKDEFSNNNKKWYQPKSAPGYTNENGIYCYFQTESGMPSNFRIRLQYESEDWLFFKKVQFSIDDKAYEYIPLNTETDSGNGGRIWEWFDEQVSQSDKALINSLATAKSAKMKLIGRQYYDIKTISKEQINSIKRTLELYKAMGGAW